MKNRTLIMVRRTLTEPNTALAGAMPEISFARFSVSIVTFNDERVPSRSFGRWGFASMVEGRGVREKTVWRVGCEEGPYYTHKVIPSLRYLSDGAI